MSCICKENHSGEVGSFNITYFIFKADLFSVIKSYVDIWLIPYIILDANFFMVEYG